jgi:hypothetical protein
VEGHYERHIQISIVANINTAENATAIENWWNQSLHFLGNTRLRDEANSSTELKNVIKGEAKLELKSTQLQNHT